MHHVPLSGVGPVLCYALTTLSRWVVPDAIELSHTRESPDARLSVCNIALHGVLVLASSVSKIAGYLPYDAGGYRKLCISER